MSTICPTCNTPYLDSMEWQCATIAVHGECASCRVAQQKFVNEGLVEAQMATTRQAQARNPLVRTFRVTVTCEREIAELEAIVGQRLWSLDGVAKDGVQVIEVTS